MMVHIRMTDMENSNFKNVISQFTPLLWITVIITMVILSLLLSATYYGGILCNFHKEPTSYSVQDMWLYTIGILCQQGNT
jgi:hypothetical protein